VPHALKGTFEETHIGLDSSLRAAHFENLQTAIALYRMIFRYGLRRKGKLLRVDRGIRERLALRVLQDRSGEAMSGGEIASNGVRSKKGLMQSDTKTGRDKDP
jgi:hypothetical protein